ncbi:glycosyltransferase family 2 protein, partial [uncultured Helicobacter sp.]|uniref:glycosyltransferase family 2 protein n=1 Tax=uncultured Helicobacter sp. TaxID=175537 RepID=UPI00374F054B
MQELDSTQTTHISIVVPCYNEEVSLPKFLEEITQTMRGIKSLFPQSSPQNNLPFYEIIFVNDGSRDKTLEILRNMQDCHTDSDYTINVYSFSRNFGKEAAILAGLQKAKGAGVILLDADLQDPPSLIPQMIRIWLDSKREIKVVYARRTTRAGESKIRAALSEMFYKLSNLIS